MGLEEVVHKNETGFRGRFPEGYSKQNKKEEAEDLAFYQEKENVMRAPCYSFQQPLGHPLDKLKHLWDTGSNSFFLNLKDNIIAG